MALTSIMGIFIITVSVGIAFVLKESTLLANKLSTYQTKIIDKKKDTTLIVIPVFVPIPQYYVFTEEGRKISVNQNWYNRINIGDIVSVTRYSNGKHTLETIETPNIV
ncbi:hypothetical protein ACFL0D_09620 [Thermoproteota archaeon]